LLGLFSTSAELRKEKGDGRVESKKKVKDIEDDMQG